MPMGSRHTVIAQTELKLIEVQTGSSISVFDKQVYPLFASGNASDGSEH